MQAIRGLPLLCKDTPEHVPKIGDVLGQLLLAGMQLFSSAISVLHRILGSLVMLVRSIIQCALVTEEGLERDAVSKALMSVLRQDTKGIPCWFLHSSQPWHEIKHLCE